MDISRLVNVVPSKHGRNETCNVDNELERAVRAVDANILRSHILTLCAKSSEFEKQIRHALLIEKESSIDYPGRPAKRHKVAVQRYVRCLQCKEQFDIESSTQRGMDQECVRHPGDLEIIDEAFPDDDEVLYHGIDIPGDWRVKEFPEGFEWSCCGGNADAEGCRRSRHSTTRNDTTSTEHREEEEEDEDSDSDEQGDGTDDD